MFPSIINEALRNEQWAQLGKDIDLVFGANSDDTQGPEVGAADWFDEDFGMYHLPTPSWLLFHYCDATSIDLVAYICLYALLVRLPLPLLLSSASPSQALPLYIAKNNATNTTLTVLPCYHTSFYQLVV